MSWWRIRIDERLIGESDLCNAVDAFDRFLRVEGVVGRVVVSADVVLGVGVGSPAEPPDEADADHDDQRDGGRRHSDDRLRPVLIPRGFLKAPDGRLEIEKSLIAWGGVHALEHAKVIAHVVFLHIVDVQLVAGVAQCERFAGVLRFQHRQVVQHPVRNIRILNPTIRAVELQTASEFFDFIREFVRFNEEDERSQQGK